MSLRMDLSNTQSNVRNSMNVDDNMTNILISGTQSQATQLYNLLVDSNSFGCNTHALVNNPNGEKYDIKVRYSSVFTDDDVEGCDMAFVFLPRTESNYNRIVSQFLHNIPKDLLLINRNKVVGVNYKTGTHKFFTL